MRGSLWARGATLPRLVASRGGRGEYVCTRPRRDVGGAARLLAPAPPSVSRWPYRTLVGIESRRRAVRPGQGRAPRDLASTDPATFPEATTWSLVTHPPTPGAAAQRTHAPAAVADVATATGSGYGSSRATNRCSRPSAGRRITCAPTWPSDGIGTWSVVRSCCAGGRGRTPLCQRGNGLRTPRHLHRRRQGRRHWW